MPPDQKTAPAGDPAAPAARPLPLQRVADPKRALDLVLGMLLLALAAPVLAAAAAALAARGGTGAVLARGQCTGLHGAPFLMRSLRTRRLRLDLLSRLPHVVSGRMSLVGPAPLPVGSPGAAPAWRRGVRPGLTGLAQVRRDSRLPWNERALLDQHYVEHRWLGLDLLLIARTPAALAASSGARAPRSPETEAPDPARRAGRTPRRPSRRARAARQRATQITARGATLPLDKWVRSARSH